jgi:glycosyltransferase involved in cell wall biosynthesis
MLYHSIFENIGEHMKISLIVPVYNVEKYLKECVNSILNQTFSDFELILVDDGSPDKSGKMCDEFAINDIRIKVIHKENGGLSSARNAGLDVITGEYVCFIDSDDIIHKKMLEILQTSIQESKAEIAVGKFKTFKDTDIIDMEHNTEVLTETITPEKLIELAIIDNDVTFSVCNKMFKSSLWYGIRFREKTYYEDEDLTYKVFDKAKTCVLCDQQIYYYRMNDEGITHTLSPKIMDQYYTRKGMYEFISDKYPALAHLSYAHWFYISIFIYYRCKFQLKYKDKKIKFLRIFDKKLLKRANKSLLSKEIVTWIKYYFILPFSLMIWYIRIIFIVKKIIRTIRK